MLKPSSKPPPAAAPIVTPNLRNVRRLTRPLPLSDGCAPWCAPLYASSNPWDISDSLRGLLDRRADAVVRAAAADVAGHRGVDVRIGGIGIAREQRGGLHHLARLAV